MPEVIIKYTDVKVLGALKDLAKIFDIAIEIPSDMQQSAKGIQPLNLPVTFAEDPDVTALAGIWEGRDITLGELRKEAWGARF